MTQAPCVIRALWRHAAAGGGGRCGGRRHCAAAVGASPRFSDHCSDIACSCCSPWGPDLLRKLAGWVAARSWRPRCWLCLLQPRATPPRSFTRSVGSAAAPGSSDPPPPPPALRLRCPPLELSQPCTLWWPQTAPVTSHGARWAWEQRRVASPGGRRRTCRVLLHPQRQDASAGRTRASPATLPILKMCALAAPARRQTMGLAFSHRRSGMPGPLTRLMSCTAEDWEALPEEDRALAASLPIRTHRAPSYSVHPRTGDGALRRRGRSAPARAPAALHAPGAGRRAARGPGLPAVPSRALPPAASRPPRPPPVYPGINKPVAVIDWLAHTEVEEDWVLIIGGWVRGRGTCIDRLGCLRARQPLCRAPPGWLGSARPRPQLPSPWLASLPLPTHGQTPTWCCAAPSCPRCAACPPACPACPPACLPACLALNSAPATLADTYMPARCAGLWSNQGHCGIWIFRIHDRWAGGCWLPECGSAGAGARRRGMPLSRRARGLDTAAALTVRATCRTLALLPGVNNELALRHVPEVEPRTDTRAGPEGRRGDQVRGPAGGWVGGCGGQAPASACCQPAQRGTCGPGNLLACPLHRWAALRWCTPPTCAAWPRCGSPTPRRCGRTRWWVPARVGQGASGAAAGGAAAGGVGRGAGCSGWQAAARRTPTHARRALRPPPSALPTHPPQAWNLTGDAYAKEGDKPWIAEM